jgi:hypothetical protein
MQLGPCDLGGFGDCLDIGLLTPVAPDMGDGAPDHVIVAGCGCQFFRIGDAIGGQHGGSRHCVPPDKPAGPPVPPDF